MILYMNILQKLPPLDKVGEFLYTKQKNNISVIVAEILCIDFIIEIYYF